MIPFLEIMWPILASYNSSLRKLFCCNIAWSHDGFWLAHYSVPNAWPVPFWREDLFHRNTTHFLHAIIESFPQCILQIVAAYYLKDTNNVWLSISIAASILMICLHFYGILLIFEIRRVVNLMYTISCFAVDFVGIIFIISILSYHPSQEEFEISSYFIMIRYLYFWEGLVCIGSLVVYTYVITSTTLIALACMEVLSQISTNDKFWRNRCTSVMCGIGCIVIGIPMMCFGVGFSLIALAFVMALLGIALGIIGVSWTLFILDSIIIGHRIFQEDSFFYDNLDWVVGETDSIKGVNGNIIMSKKQNKIVKLCIINQIILQNHPLIALNDKDVPRWEVKRWENYYDTGLIDYLDNHQRQKFKKCIVERNETKLYRG